MTKRQENWQGMNWIRKDKRLAIYLRDGMACAYCGRGIEDNMTFTLDHLVPHSKGGDNKETNLVTCCKTCNSSRGDRDLLDFIEAVAAYLDHGITAAAIWDFIYQTSTRDLRPYRKQAKQILANRSTFAGALEEANDRC